MSQPDPGAQVPIQEFIVPRDGDRDLKFRGRIIAKVSSRRAAATRWTELALYRTVGNDYVCHKAGISTVAGEMPRQFAIVIPFEGIDGVLAEELVKEFFGREALAKQLYAQGNLLDVAPASNPLVFISYAHSDETAQRVTGLAARLRASGIEAEFDRYETSPSQGWTWWMIERIKTAAFVLVVCDAIYAKHLDQQGAPRGRGVRQEARLLARVALEQAEKKDQKVIPVVFSTRDLEHIPSFLSDFNHYDVSSEMEFQRLCRRLTEGGHGVPRPPVLRPAREAAAAEGHSALPSSNPPSAETSDARTWAMLLQEGGQFALLPFTRLERDEQRVLIAVAADNAGASAWLSSMLPASRHAFLPNRPGALLGLAFDTSAHLVRLQNVKQTRAGTQETWTLTLDIQPENFGASDVMEVSFGSTSADALARMRAERILLNQHPQPQQSSGIDLDAAARELFLRGHRTPLQVGESPFPGMFREFGKNPAFFITACRLYATMLLRLSGVVQTVTRLDLALEGDQQLRVHFEGVRARKYENVDATVINVSGSCALNC